SVKRLLPTLLVLLACPLPGRAAEPAAASGIALAVVFDTSGSMNEQIATKPGAPLDAKYRIAQRAFNAVIDRLERFSKGPTAQPLQVGIFVFRDQRAAVAAPIAPFEPARLRRWATTMHPSGATPLGEAIFLAGRDLLATPAATRHLLVLTDGANTAGRSPETALTQIAQAAARKQTPVFTHIIALDIA